MELNVRSVAVIGAGIAGLASIKSCLEAGLEPVCYEKGSQIGGVWVLPEERRTNPRGPACVYEGMITNITKESMCYSDFPYPRQLPPFLKVPEVMQYLNDYADNFDLLRRIHFDTEVLEVAQTDDFDITGRWRVTTRSAGCEQSQTEVFDAVLVCTGMYSSGDLPDYPGMDGFTGEILHSCQFRRAEDFKDKTILTVGPSHSAGDIAVICSDRAKKVYMSLRDGAWIAPRIFDGETTDLALNKRFQDLLPAWLVEPIAKRKFDSRLDWEGLGLKRSKHPLGSVVMINDTLPIKIMSGQIGVRSGIKQFDGSKIMFDDGSIMDDIDCVIFGTGFNLHTPFVDESIISDDFRLLDLYMHIIPPRLKHHTIAAIGFFMTRGSTSSTSEIQARFAVQVFKGQLKLPPVSEMLQDVQRRKNNLFRQYGKYRPAIVPSLYNDELARAIGALPSFWDLILKDPKLAFKFYFGPLYPECYRLVGPNSTPHAREDFLRSGADLVAGITVGTVRPDALGRLPNSKEGTRKFLRIILALVGLFTFLVYFF